MKRRLMILCAVAASLMVLGAQSSAQYYRSITSGNWSASGTWQTSTDSSTWGAASNGPTGTESIAIQAGHTVTIDVAADSVYSGGRLYVFGTVATLGTTKLLISTTHTPYGTMNVENGGTYNHVMPAASTGAKSGLIPSATWLTGSTILITGTATGSSFDGGAAQNFYNYTFNATSQSVSLGMGFGSLVNGQPMVIGGNLSFLNTGTGRCQYFTSTGGSFKVMGKFIISGSSNVTMTGSSSSQNDTAMIYGNVNVNTTGNFSISRGSVGNVGNLYYWFFGDTVSITAAAMQNSDTGYVAYTSWVFKKAGTQYLKFNPTAVSSNRAFNVQVDTGSTVELLAPTHIVSKLFLNGGKIVSSSANPLIMGWYTGSVLYSGALGASPDTAIVQAGSPTSFVEGPMSYLYNSAAGKSFTYPIGKGSAYRPVTLSLSQTAATLSTYTAEMFLGNANTLNSVGSSGLDHVSYVDYYNIAESGGGSAFTAGAVTLSYGTQGVNDGVWDPTATSVAQGPVSGGSWVDLGPGVVSVGSGSPQTNTVTSTTAFTDLTTDVIFTLGSLTNTSDNPLPVEMTSFTASTDQDGVTLHWSMASELNNTGWDVERAAIDASGNAGAYAKIGYIKGETNSVSTTNYSFLDKKALYGSYEYRLRQIDVNGDSKLSNTIKVSQLVLPKTIELGSFPNPFNPTATLRFALPKGGRVTLEIYNAIGQLVTTLVDRNMEAGIFETTFDASSLPSGLYMARLKVDNSAMFTKMLLVK
ncbi:MAG TPA: T9SS type A sorting domain-containing protein [Candidatus Kryptonia bacterium]